MDKPSHDSTLIRHGRDAVTFPEMTEFATMLEQRPFDKLLEELPGLSKFSEPKFALAVGVLRRRIRAESDSDRRQLESLAEELASDLDDETRTRILSIFR
jgi:hypothetical protein